jgi:hypothetical protein
MNALTKDQLWVLNLIRDLFVVPDQRPVAVKSARARPGHRRKRPTKARSARRTRRGR